MLEDDAMDLAIHDASKGKIKRPRVARLLENTGPKKDALRKELLGGTWRPPVHPTENLQEGLHRKPRAIVKPHWNDEQMVHHLIVGQLMKIIIPRLHRHAYGCIPRARFGPVPGKAPPPRGTHGAMKTMRRWVKSYGGKRFYVAELDIKQFYASIDHEILMTALKRTIRDRRFTDLVQLIVEPYQGLPLGFYTSPWLANFYLLPMDNFILQELKPDHYLRYMDNMFLLATSKRKLHRMKDRLEAWMSEHLNLRIKENWQIFRLEDSKTYVKGGKTRRRGRAINCLGFVVHRGHVGLRKGILKRIRRKARKQKRTHRFSWYDASAYLSYMGYLWITDTRTYYLKHLRPLLTVSACKRRVAAAARRAKA